MAQITKEELLKIAEMSHLEVADHEVATLLAQIQNVLTYAERVQEVIKFEQADQPRSKNINVAREDVIVNTPTEPILSQAPEREEDYFVVPVIIEQ